MSDNVKLSIASAFQQDKGDVPGGPPASGTAAKVDPALIGLTVQTVERRAPDPNGERAAGDLPFLFQGETVVAQFRAVEGRGAALLAALEGLGLEKSALSGDELSGRLPLAAIDDLQGLDDLRWASPSYAVTRVGLAENQAERVHESDLLRDGLGLDGSGISIGILSDSFDTSTTPDDYATDIATGDLPSNVQILDDSFLGGIDEGRAMAQLIHDLVPGAQLLFRTAFNGPTDFANGIVELANAGADVIVDDIGYLTEPFFEDGVIAQAADAVFNAGIPYFSSAGNSGRDSHEVLNPTFVESDPAFFGLLDFDPGSGVDTRQNFQLQPGQSILISLQWDEPFGNVSTDIDIGVLQGGTDTVLAGSFENQLLTGEPVEFFGFQNQGSSVQSYDLIVQLFDGPAPNIVKYIDFNGGTGNRFSDGSPVTEFYSNSSTSFGHPNASGGAGVGAVRYTDSPAFGTPQPLLEDFSSAGGTPIFFDTSGNRLANPEVRQGVLFSAANGTDTTFFGQDFEGNGLPNFFGTSAAAPHAAALAAQVLQIDPTLMPGQIYNLFQNTATDIRFDNAGDSTGTGFDQDSGAGLVRIDRAVSALLGDDFGDDPASAGTLVGGGNAGGLLEEVGDRDSFLIDLTAGQTADIEVVANFSEGGVFSSGGGALIPAEVALFDPSGTLVDSDTASSGQGPANVSVTAPTDGEYRLSIGAAGAKSVGVYQAAADVSGGQPTTLAIAANNADRDEGDSGTTNFTFTVSRGGDTDGSTTVDFRVLPGGPTDNADFVGASLPSGTVSFGPNDTSEPIVIPVSGDTLVEGNEGFTVRLSNASGGAIINTSDASGVIRNDDEEDGGEEDGATGGPDSLVGTNGPDNIDGLGGDDTIEGRGGNDTLIGGQGRDSIAGQGGNDEIDGGGQADTISGGPGEDTVAGGNGTDVISLDNDDDVFDDTPQNDQAGDDSVLGGFGNDTLNGDGGRDTLNGQGGDDVIFGGLSDDSLIGGNGNDQIDGGNRFDFIDAGGGNDTVAGSFGRDTIFLGGGNDVFIDNSQNDIGGGDTVFGGAGDDTLGGEGGADQLEGGDGDDEITGGRGNDLIRGDAGADDIDSGEGNDTVVGGSGADTIRLGDGDDLFVDDSTGGALGRDLVFGQAGDDDLRGTAGSDTLIGGSGNDTLRGSFGGDRLAGGTENDTLAGGTGADIFVFADPDSTDRVQGFTPAAAPETFQDIFELGASGFPGLPTGVLPAANFDQGAASTSNPTIVQDGRAVSFDPDGTGPQAPDRFATLDAGVTLTSDDFLVV